MIHCAIWPAAAVPIAALAREVVGQARAPQHRQRRHERTATKVVTKRGNIGQQIFEQVEQLTADGAMNRLAAFKQLASASGRQVGTVAANYYRVARQRGAALQPRGPGKAPTGRGRGWSRIVATLRVLERLLQQQEEEIAQLRKENARFAQLRRLLEP